MDFIGNELAVQDDKAIGISMEKLELKHEAAIRTDIRNKAEHDRREICRKVELKREEEDQRYQRELTAEMRRLVEEKLNPDKPWSNDDVNGIISEAERSKLTRLYYSKIPFKSSMKDGISKRAKKSRRKSDRYLRQERKAPL